MNLSRRKSSTSADCSICRWWLFRLVQRLVAPPLGAEDLQLDLLDLDRQDLRLVNPFV